MEFVSLLVLLCVTSFIAIGDDLASSKNAEKPMNVVFILADDLGWSDTELYGMTKLYKTPNILRLAQRGRTFTQAYSNSPLFVRRPGRVFLPGKPLRGMTVLRQAITQNEFR